jgi:hypothetical protein
MCLSKRPTPSSPEPQASAATGDAIAALAKRFWSIHPKEIQDMGITREQFYEREMRALFATLVPGEPQSAPVQASEFWEALKQQCAATPDKSKVKALIQVRCEDVVAAWNTLAHSRPERSSPNARGVAKSK